MIPKQRLETSCTEIKEPDDKGHNKYEGKDTSNNFLDKPKFFKDLGLREKEKKC